MSIPASLNISVLPQELELIASETLVDIIPLVAMDKTAFVSVSQFDRVILIYTDIAVLRELTDPCALLRDVRSPSGSQQT